jgi:hypothetical protein
MNAEQLSESNVKINPLVSTQKKAPDEPALSESQRQKDTKAIRSGAPETAARSSLSVASLIA